MKQKLGYLILETGEIYLGVGYGSKKNSIEELVFNTSITGYQEVIVVARFRNDIGSLSL